MSGVLYEPAAIGARTRLVVTTCHACERVEFPPASGPCRSCGGRTVIESLTGRGTLSVVTEVLAQPPGALIQAPYSVAVADYDRGIRVIGLLEGEAQRGDPVEVVVAAPYEGGETFSFTAVPPSP